MKKYFIFALFFVCTLELTATIYEVNSIHQIREYIDKESLVIFDIDNTLIEPTQSLGSDQWFYARKTELVANGIDPLKALHQSLREWIAIQNLTDVKVVEEGTEELLKGLQEEKYTVMGLTTRGYDMAFTTIKQLKSLGIHLKLTAPSKEEVYFKNGPRGVLFTGGILFTAATQKGEALCQYLSHIGLYPKRIVFINDKSTHLNEVKVVADKFEVPFIGLRYNFLDAKIDKYDHAMTRIQFEQFGKFLSDEEASLNLLRDHF